MPISRSPMPRSCCSGVTTPRRMFWSTWSMKMTRPSTHIGQTETATFRADGAAGVCSGTSADVGVMSSVPGSGMSSCSCSAGGTASVVTAYSSSTLDRHADERPVLGPRAVVVLDLLVAEKLGEHEPCVRRTFADPAVGDDRLPGVDPRAAVELLQLIGRLERAVFVGRSAPGDVGRA